MFENVLLVYSSGMGNKIFAGYSTGKDPLPGCNRPGNWKAVEGTRKDRVDDKVVIFIYEKTGSRESGIVDALRRDALALQRLRHPGILSVVETLVDERSALGFAVKPFAFSLAGLLEISSRKLALLEIKSGLIDLASALAFLHNDVKTAHLNISPDSVFITASGKWLLGGFSLAEQQVTRGKHVELRNIENVAWEFCAPEISKSGRGGFESDLFSLGLLFAELLSKRPVLGQRLDRSSHQSEISRKIPLRNFTPVEAATLIQGMTEMEPAARTTAEAVMSSEYLNDLPTRTLRFMDTLQEKDDGQKSQFLAGLGKMMPSLSEPRLLCERVIPCIASCLGTPLLWHAALSLLLPLLPNQDSNYFQLRVWPSMKPLFTAKEIKLDTVLMLVAELETLSNLATVTESATVLLPFVIKCLEIPEESLLNSVIKRLPAVLKKSADSKYVREFVLPKLLALLSGPNSVARVRAVLLGCLASDLLNSIDRQTISDLILPALEKLTVFERIAGPGVAAAFLSCAEQLSKVLGTKLTAQRVIQLILPLLVDDQLGIDDYSTCLEIVKSMMGRIEKDRQREMASRSERGLEVRTVLGAGVEPPPVPAPPVDFESLISGDSPVKKTAPAMHAPQPAVDLFARPATHAAQPALDLFARPATHAAQPALDLFARPAMHAPQPALDLFARPATHAAQPTEDLFAHFASPKNTGDPFAELMSGITK